MTHGQTRDCEALSGKILLDRMDSLRINDTVVTARSCKTVQRLLSRGIEMPATPSDVDQQQHLIARLSQGRRATDKLFHSGDDTCLATVELGLEFAMEPSSLVQPEGKVFRARDSTATSFRFSHGNEFSLSYYRLARSLLILKISKPYGIVAC